MVAQKKINLYHKAPQFVPFFIINPTFIYDSFNADVSLPSQSNLNLCDIVAKVLPSYIAALSSHLYNIIYSINNITYVLIDYTCGIATSNTTNLFGLIALALMVLNF